MDANGLEGEAQSGGPPDGKLAAGPAQQQQEEGGGHQSRRRHASGMLALSQDNLDSLADFARLNSATNKAKKKLKKQHKRRRKTQIKRKRTMRNVVDDDEDDDRSGARIRIVKKSNLRGKNLFKQSAKRLINAKRMMSVAKMNAARGPQSAALIQSVRDQILASDVLDNVGVFKDCGLKDAQKERMAEWMRVENFRAGEAICTEGEEGHKLFLITQETVQVIIGGAVVSTMGKDETFGEVALMQPNCKRTATITAADDVVLLSLTRDDFQAILNSGGGRRASRTMDHHAEEPVRLLQNTFFF